MCLAHHSYCWTVFFSGGRSRRRPGPGLPPSTSFRRARRPSRPRPGTPAYRTPRNFRSRHREAPDEGGRPRPRPHRSYARAPAPASIRLARWRSSPSTRTAPCRGLPRRRPRPVDGSPSVALRSAGNFDRYGACRTDPSIPRCLPGRRPGKHTAAAVVCDFWREVVAPPFEFALEAGLQGAAKRACTDRG